MKLVRNKVCRFWRAVCITVCACAGVAKGHDQVEMREIMCRVRLEMAAVAERSESLNNPLDRPVILDFVEDGSWIDKGEQLMAFDPFPVSNEWKKLQARMDITQAELALRLKDADNTMTELTDKLRAEEDKLKVAVAALDRLWRLPETNDVLITEGRVRVAVLTYLAESNALVRAEERLRKNYISPVAFEKQRSSAEQAKAKLEQAQTALVALLRGAEPLEIEQRELSLENQRLALTNLIDQIEDTRSIVELRKQSARVRSRRLDRQIKDRERDLNEVNFKAPREGFLTYTKSFLSRFVSGTDRMWRRFTFARIPDMTSTVFRGGLPEQYRRFFQVDDIASLRVVGRLDKAVPGRVVAVAELARDSSEREESGWDDPNRESGVKVYDVTVRPDELAPWMYLGMHAEVYLERREPLLAPAVPAEYLIHRDGQNFLYLNNALRQVSGSVMEGWFVLTETNLLGMTVGHQPARRDTRKSPAADNIPKGMDVLFETSGELVPLDSTDVRVRPIMGWQKIAWLLPEDSIVTNGQVVCILDDKETQDRLTERDNQLEERVSNREAQSQALDLLLRKNETRLTTISNNLRVAQIKLDLVKRGTEEEKLITANLDLTLTQISEQDALRDYKAVTNRPSHLVAPQEIVRAGRRVRKAALVRERSGLSYEKLKKKPLPIELTRAEAALAEALLSEETGRLSTETDAFASRVDLQWNQRSEQNAIRWRGHTLVNLTNLTVRATRDGTLRYRKIWNQGAFAKVQPGINIGSGMAPVYIADMDRMEIRAEAPEEFYLNVKEGMRVLVQIPAVSDEFFSGEIGSIEYLFEAKKQANVDRGLYSGHEPLGETVFIMRVMFTLPEGIDPKAGAIARIVVPKTTEAGE